jgi:hypothetical protein
VPPHCQLFTPACMFQPRGHTGMCTPTLLYVHKYRPVAQHLGNMQHARHLHELHSDSCAACRVPSPSSQAVHSTLQQADEQKTPHAGWSETPQQPTHNSLVETTCNRTHHTPHAQPAAAATANTPPRHCLCSQLQLPPAGAISSPAHNCSCLQAPLHATAQVHLALEVAARAAFFCSSSFATS